jgi:signal transduction histidine kinase
LHYLLDSSDMYVFHIDAKEGMVYYYRSMESPETIMTFSEYLDCLYEEERPEAMHFMQQLSHLTEPFSVIHHFRHTPVSDTPECYVVSVMPVVKSDKESHSYLGVLRNITKLVEGQQQLRDERQRAEASARMKSAYLANMAHELRTPLNSIVGFSDLLGFVDEPEDRREFMRIILNNCDMLLRLVDDIILTQTNEQAVLTIEPTECDFAQVFNDICTSLEQRVQEPDVAFLKDNPYDHFRISVDKGRMQQILTNFVTNAVKYTHHGHIKVGYSYVDGGLRLYCEDTGAGIPKEKQASVFERFVMLNGNAVQGTGLGLNICKTIAENCGGKIGVTSEGAGYGSTFWVWIPCPRC